jgi:short-subunit dehydrogenase
LIVNARTIEALEETCQLVKKAGGEAYAVAGDLSNTSMAGVLVQTCIEKFGDIDLLFNNAGLAKPGPITKLTPADWEQVFAVNFFAPLHAIYAALPHFLGKRSGKIVNVSSVASKVSFPGSVCYAASKFALTGMSEGMAAELGRMGIDILTVCPGWVRTEFFKKNDIPDEKNPTAIAAKNDLPGLLMRHLLSISSEHCAKEIVDALGKDGSQELIMTAPGVAVERLKALFPGAVSTIAQLVPVDNTGLVEHDRAASKS